MKKYQHYYSLLFGLLLVSLSFNLFLAPFHLVTGGISGLALIMNKVFLLQESTFIMIMNLFLLIISFFFLGKEKTKKTILGSILFPIFIRITSFLVPFISFFHLELFIIVVLGGTLSGIGYGFIFKSGFTSGGTDILNQIMEKYFLVPISTSILIVDGTITIFSGLIFGFSTMIYSLIGLLLVSVMTNKTITGIDENKTLYIYSSKYKEIKEYLHEELKIDSTDFDCFGGYKNQKEKMILTVINKKEYYKIKEGIKLIDKNAFIVVTNAYHSMNENVLIRQV